MSKLLDRAGTKATPVYVKNLVDKELDLDFEISKDTKFTLRLLLSICLFVIVVFHYKIYFRFMGVQIFDSSKLKDVAELSMVLVVIHTILFIIYFWKDILDFNNKETLLNEELVKLNKELENEEVECINSYYGSTHSETGQPLSESDLYKSEKDFINNCYSYKNIADKIKYYRGLKNINKFVVIGIHMLYPFVAVIGSMFLLTSVYFFNNISLDANLKDYKVEERNNAKRT